MESLRRIAPGAYLVAVLLFLITAVDYLGNAWPFLPGEVNWRYGVVGMVSTRRLAVPFRNILRTALASGCHAL